VSISESVTQNELNALQVAIFHRSCHHSSVPGDIITCCFWWKSGTLMSVNRKWNLFLPLLLWRNTF